MAKGTLLVNAKRQVRIKWTNAKGKHVEMAVSDVELSAPLKRLRDSEQTVAQLNDQEVEFDEVGGQPKKVRAAGEIWQQPGVAPPAAQGGAGSQRGGGRGRPQQGQGRPQGQGGGRGQPRGGRQPNGQREGEQPGANLDPAFHNPYNFVPALPRDHLPAGSELGDGPPIGHERYHADRSSGVITVMLTTATPLPIPDAAVATENADGHKTFPVRLGPDGKPYLAPTSVKGMLRAAYEAVTNSRFGVFEDHNDRLAYRMEAGVGLSLVPARVQGNEIVLYLGTTGGLPSWNNQLRRWAVPGDLQYAAWLPRYKGARLAYRGGGEPQHGEEVWCWLEKFQHWRWDRNAQTHRRDFQYWKVTAIARSLTALGGAPAPTIDPGKENRCSYHEPLGQPMIQVSGYACITNENIKNKHDERVFFVHGQNLIRIPLEQEHVQAWRELISNYQATHEKDLEQRRRRGQRPDQYLGDEPGKTAWSRHVYERAARDLGGATTLCFAFVQQHGAGYVARSLYPVMISRGLHQTSPICLVSPSLHPAAERSSLSPADRVFGWVRQSRHSSNRSRDGVACRGNLRVSPVKCVSNDPVQSFTGNGIPLAILGQPKPQQARFYVAASPRGQAQAGGQTKELAGYSPGKGVRGRKVYPHHTNLPPHYWDQPLQDRTQQSDSGHFQEYRRSHKPRKRQQGNKQIPVMNADGTFQLLQGENNEQRDDQNRSIRGWIKPATEFTFDLRVTNLSQVELGALLFSLTLREGHFHRLGGGKPLGFGSVRVEITGHDLRDGSEWGNYYCLLDEPAPPAFDVVAAVKAFKQAVVSAYGGQAAGGDLEARFEQVPFIAAFLRAAAGFEDGKPVHYPRARQDGQTGPVPPHPEGKAYEWFVANDRMRQGSCPGHSLPNLADDKGLPILDT